MTGRIKVEFNRQASLCLRIISLVRVRYMRRNGEKYV